MRLRKTDVVRGGVVVVLLALAAGCVTRSAPPHPKADLLPGPIAVLPPTPITSTPAKSAPTRAPSEPTETRSRRGPEPVTPPPPPPTVPPVPAGQQGRMIVLNFDNADIETVIHAASEIVGFNYVLAPDVRGKVTVQTSGRIAAEDVFGVLLAILEVQGFTAVKSGSLYKVIRIEGARERAVPTIIGSTADPARNTDEIITQIVPLRFTNANDVSALLRPLVSSRGNLITHRETNILMITDAASNVRRLLDIVRLVDVEVALEELQIIPVRYADAADLANILNQLFTTGRLRSTGAPGTASPVAPPVAPPTAPGTLRPPTGPGETTSTERPPLIVAERRSNSLIIHARRQEVEMIRRLINQLDINIYSGRRVFIYFAENAKSKDLAATLNAIYGAREPGATGTTSSPATPGATRPTVPPYPPTPGAGPLGGASGTSVGSDGLVEGQVRFIADETTNAIIVTTFPRNWAEIESTIRQLDRMPRQVLIEVLVAEITLTDDFRFGIDWALRNPIRAAQQTINADTPTITSPSTLIPPAVALALPGAGLTGLAIGTREFFAMVNTLASNNQINVLSSPHIMTTENKKAVINVSDSIPIVTSQQVPIGGTTTQTATNTTSVVGTQSVEYRDAGVILTVTPRIGEKGTVALDIKQEVNDIGAAEPPTGSRRIIKREAETSVVLMNNQTLVLGGLIKEQVTINDRGIPLLKDIPVLGYLFGAKVRTTNKTELLIVITPRVIGTPLDAARVTEELRRASPEADSAMRNSTRPPSPPLRAVPMPPPLIRAP
jgi:general secretion pathway protein D